MWWQRWLVVVILGTGSALAGAGLPSVLAQQGRVQLLGTRPFVVYKTLNDANSNTKEDVADFDNEDAAKSDAQLRNAKEPLSSGWIFWTRKRSPEELRRIREEIPAPKSTRPIEMPKRRPPVDVPTPRSVVLENSKWVGNEILEGYDRLEFHFLPNNKVKMIDARRTIMGTVDRYSDNGVNLTFRNGEIDCTYYGKIEGGVIYGDAASDSGGWKWKVRRQR